jgi:hypothetical protein
MHEKLREIETEREGLSEWVLKNRSTEKGMRFLNQQLEDIDTKEQALKTALWEIEDKFNEAETEDFNVETITNYLAHFAGMYDSLEVGEKKLYVESLIKRVEIGKDREITLTLQVPLGEFRVLIPHLSPKRRKTHNGVYNLH